MSKTTLKTTAISVRPNCEPETTVFTNTANDINWLFKTLVHIMPITDIFDDTVLRNFKTIYETDFYSISVFFTEHEHCDNVNYDEISSIHISIKKPELIYSNLIEFVNGIPNIELLTFGYTRLELFMITLITGSYFKIHHTYISINDETKTPYIKQLKPLY